MAPQKKNNSVLEYIVIHHGGDPRPLSMEEAKKIYTNSHGIFPYHYMIDKHGEVRNAREIDDPIGSTMNVEYNNKSVQIVLIGNFQVDEPSNAQYRSLSTLIRKIKNKKGDLKVIGHNEVPDTATSCPGKNFNKSKIF